MINYKTVAKYEYKTVSKDKIFTCIRIPGDKTCCSRLTFLSRWNESDSVRQVCSNCDEYYTLSHEGFSNSDCFQAACPRCNQPMNKFLNDGISNRYSFECKKCGTYYNASDFLPELL